MEVAMAMPVVPGIPFDSSTCASPYVSATSSPTSYTGGSYPVSHLYSSAPTSPSSAAAIYDHLQASASAGVPFAWEELPGVPKRRYCPKVDEKGKGTEDVLDDDDFAFEFSGQLVMGGAEEDSVTADELFEAGRIRPLPLLTQKKVTSTAIDSFPGPSPRNRRASLEEFIDDPHASRGKDRAADPLGLGGSFRRSRRAARSLSPVRGSSDFHAQDHPPPVRNRNPLPKPNGNSSTAGGAKSSTAVAAITGYVKGGIKRWGLRNLLLFRSASEGRVSGGRRKDTLTKYTNLSPAAATMLSRMAAAEDSRSPRDNSGSSRRRVGRDGGGSTVGSARRGPASAHELIYTKNRAVSEEMKRRTFLPYRQGLLGCLGFNPAIHGLAMGFGSSAAATLAHRRE